MRESCHWGRHKSLMDMPNSSMRTGEQNSTRIIWLGVKICPFPKHRLPILSFISRQQDRIQLEFQEREGPFRQAWVLWHQQHRESAHTESHQCLLENICYVLSTAWSLGHIIKICQLQFSKWYSKGFSIPILWKRKLRLKKFTELTQGPSLYMIQEGFLLSLLDLQIFGLPALLASWQVQKNKPRWPCGFLDTDKYYSC
jgi:hypothetical protein